MAEPGNNSFDPLVKGLSLEQRLEFFRVLHTAGVTRQDVELAQLLRALQLYKAFYDEIPGRVCQAVKEADALHQTFKSLHESAAIRLDRVLSQLERNTTVASTITNEFREAKTVIAAAIQKSTTDIAQTLEATLKTSLSCGLLTPFERFVNDIDDRCAQTAIEANQISLQLKQARRIHIGGYALAAMVLTLVLTAIIWINTSRHYNRAGGTIDSTNRPESPGLVGTGAKGCQPESRAQPQGCQQALSDHQACQRVDGRPGCGGGDQVEVPCFA
jgi:hypothetical protein